MVMSLLASERWAVEINVSEIARPEIHRKLRLQVGLLALHSPLSMQPRPTLINTIIPYVFHKTCSFFTIADTSPTIILIDAIKFPYPTLFCLTIALEEKWRLINALASGERVSGRMEKKIKFPKEKVMCAAGERIPLPVPETHSNKMNAL